MTVFAFFETCPHIALYEATINGTTRIYVNRPDLNGVMEIGDKWKRFISKSWYE